jgi:hypothetical protein
MSGGCSASAGDRERIVVSGFAQLDARDPGRARSVTGLADVSLQVIGQAVDRDAHRPGHRTAALLSSTAVTSSRFG